MRAVHRRYCRGIDRDIREFQDWLAHVHGCLGDLAGLGLDFDGEDAVAGFHAHGVAAGEIVVEGVFGDAANAVAAHFGFAAVGVEHAHADVGFLGGEDEDQAVGSDAEVAIGDADGEARGIGDCLGEAVDVDVVVPDALHFRELHEFG